jgi:hypothetical protein
MARVRNFLIDNTLGKVFTNVQNITAANATNIIAGTKLQSRLLSTGAAVPLRIVNNLSNIGLIFPTDSIITTIKVSLLKSTTWPTTRLRIKSGTSYSTATTVVPSISIPVNSLTVTSTVNLNIPAGNYVYVDIIDASPVPTSAGAGLSVTFNFYAN